MKHAQPRELAELKGATKHDPQRYRKTPPKSEFAIGNPPAHLCSDAKAAWFELQNYAIPGVLTAAERPLLEIASNLVAEYRMDILSFPTNRLSALIGCLARLGMSPADRQRLGVEKPPEKNEFDEF